MRLLTGFLAQPVSLWEYEDSEGFTMLSTLNLANGRCTQAIYFFSRGKLIELWEPVTVRNNVHLALAKWDEAAEPDMKDASWLSRRRVR